MWRCIVEVLVSAADRRAAVEVYHVTRGRRGVELISGRALRLLFDVDASSVQRREQSVTVSAVRRTTHFAVVVVVVVVVVHVGVVLQKGVVADRRRRTGS